MKKSYHCGKGKGEEFLPNTVQKQVSSHNFTVRRNISLRCCKSVKMSNFCKSRLDAITNNVLKNLAGKAEHGCGRGNNRR